MRIFKSVILAIVAAAFSLAAMANDLGGFGTPGKQALNVSFIGTGNNNATGNVSTYTFTAQSIGTALGDRYVVVAFHFRDNVAAAPTLNSATIGGASATILQSYAQSTNSTVGFLISSAPIASGTTADIVFNWSAATIDSVGIFVYTINQLVRPLNIIGSSTYAASATIPAVIPSAASEGGAVMFWIMRNTGNNTNTFSPTESGTIGGGTCGTGTGNCFSGFSISTSPASGTVTDTQNAGSVGGAFVTLR